MIIMKFINLKLTFSTVAFLIIGLHLDSSVLEKLYSMEARAIKIGNLRF